MYDFLKQYAKEQRGANPGFGWNGNVPTNYKTSDGTALGRWVNRQRVMYGKTNNLDAERAKKLDVIGLRPIASSRQKSWS